NEAEYSGGLWLSGTGLRELTDVRRKILDLHRTLIPGVVLAERHLTVLHLAIARDQHVGDLAQFGLADLAAYRLGALVELDAHASLAEPLAHRRRVLQVSVGDRQHDRLHRRQPHGKLAGIVLDQDADEAL